MPYAGVNGQRLYYEVGGDGDGVVILHGALADGDMMEAPATGLATGMRAIRIDRRGRGRSSPLQEPLAPGQEAADLAALLDWFGIEATHLLAHDDGAQAAVEFGLLFPDRLLSLGLLAPILDGAPQTAEGSAFRAALQTALKIDAVKALEERWFPSPVFDVVKEREGMFDRVVSMVRRSAESARTLERQPQQAIETLERLSALKTRCMVMVGDRDEPERLAMAKAVSDAIEGSELITFPGLSRFLHVEDSRAVMRRLTDFYMPEPVIER